MVKKLLGDAVREERLRRNLSQNSLAEQAKISLRTVSDIENYIGNPQLETLYALATYLHISIDAIFSKHYLTQWFNTRNSYISNFSNTGKSF